MTATGIVLYRANKYWGYLRFLAPEDWQQCVAIGEFHSLTEMGRQMRALSKSLGLRVCYGTQRSERKSVKGIERKPDTRPSREKRRTGYRTNSEQHRAARLKLTPELRTEIARQGAIAMWNKKKGATMTRRESFSALFSAPLVERPEHKNKRAHHDGDQLYHGPIFVTAEVTDLAVTSTPFKTTHRHPALRIEHDSVVYLFRCLPIGASAYVGEIIRTPQGTIRCHVWLAIPDCLTAPTVEKLMLKWKPDPEIRQL